jgi:hypothetical protein
MTVAKAPSYNNSVPFPCAGEGALLRFRTCDLMALEAQYGDDWIKLVSDKLNASSPAMLVACLKAGLKKADGKEPWGAIDFNDLPFSPWDSREQIMDAVAMAITGKTYAAILDERDKAKQAGEAIAQAFENPLIGSDSSDASSEPDTASDSLKIAS